MIVGISGAQGSGKSSLLVELRRRGWRVDQFKVSRAVQEALNWKSLDNVMQSWDTMTAFQDEIFNQKVNNDMLLSSSTDIVLGERTFADIIAYTNLWTWKHVDKNSVSLQDAMGWLTEYTKKCTRAQEMYSAVILLPFMSDVISWQEDPNRASQQDISAVWEDIERFVEMKMPITKKRFTISKKSISDRADQVEAFLKTL